MARIIGFLGAYKRLIAWLAVFLVVAYSAFRLIHPGEFGRFYDLFGIALNVVLIASQVFWIRRVGELGKRLIRSEGGRRGVAGAGVMVYFFLLGNDLLGGEETFNGFGMTLPAGGPEARFKLWLL